MSVHKKCIPKAMQNCRGSSVETTNHGKSNEQNEDSSKFRFEIFSARSWTLTDEEETNRETNDELNVTGRNRDLSSSPIHFSEQDDDESQISRIGNVGAQRLIQSIKRTKRANGGALFWEGWMIFRTNKDFNTEKRYYWRVDASWVQNRRTKTMHRILRFFLLCSCITMYLNEATNKFSREILLENVVLQLNTNDELDHYFEIRSEQVSFYCGCKKTLSRVRKRRSTLKIVGISKKILSRFSTEIRSRLFIFARSKRLYANSTSIVGIQRRWKRNAKCFQHCFIAKANSRYQWIVQTQSDRSSW